VGDNDSFFKIGKPLGTVQRLGKSGQPLFNDGFSLVATGCDIAIYSEALTNLVNERDVYVLESS
jgi:hypothetical protein